MSETLTLAELREITKAKRKSRILQWLKSNGWKHFENAAGEPVVGRVYARYKLAGMNVPSSSVEPNFDFGAIA
jgi:hypothetical protein